MCKDNLIYYGSMADSHIIMLQVLESKKQGDIDVATRVSVQLQLTDPAAKSRDRIVKWERRPKVCGHHSLIKHGCYIFLKQIQNMTMYISPQSQEPATNKNFPKRLF